MKSFIHRKEDVKRQCYLVDAQGKILGRLASKIAALLRGKTKPTFTPFVDMADEVIVINASKVRVTGKKLKEKMYQRYSGYPGGRKEVSLDTVLNSKPEQVIIHAVKGMLPKNALGRRILKKLKVYSEKEHPHQAQKPVELKI